MRELTWKVNLSDKMEVYAKGPYYITNISHLVVGIVVGVHGSSWSVMQWVQGADSLGSLLSICYCLQIYCTEHKISVLCIDRAILLVLDVCVKIWQDNLSSCHILTWMSWEKVRKVHTKKPKDTLVVYTIAAHNLESGFKITFWICDTKAFNSPYPPSPMCYTSISIQLQGA